MWTMDPFERVAVLSIRGVGAWPVAATGIEPTVFTPRDHDGSGPIVTVGGGAAGWSGRGFTKDTGGGYLEEYVDGRIQRLRLGQSDLRLDLAFTALRWQQRPQAARFLPNARTELFVWQAEVSRREVDDRTVLGVGRLWPRHVPGLSMIDGLQLGRRNETGGAEAGLYTGTEPTDAGLVPTRSDWVVGAYGALAAAEPRDSGLPSAAVESRVGARRAPAGGALREAELLGQLWGRSWSLGGGGRATSAPDDARPRLEFAHLHLRARDRGRIGGWMELRYLGTTARDEPGPTNEQPSRAGGYHGAFGTRADLSSTAGLALLGSVHRDRASGLRSFDGTLELRLPRLFSEAGGLWLAAAVTEGWVRSRGAYVQYLGAPAGAARVFARVAARTTRSDVPDALADLTEVDGYLHLDASVTERVRFRCRSSFFLPIAVQGQSPLTPRLSYQLGLDAVAMF